MKNLRIFLIGFIVGGGFGAKVGAYVSVLSLDYISWFIVEWGAGIGIALGLVISGSIVLVNSGVFVKKEKESKETDRQIATGSI